jgi:tetratricopeptide (TPR) repeat protein
LAPAAWTASFEIASLIESLIVRLENNGTMVGASASVQRLFELLSQRRLNPPSIPLLSKHRIGSPCVAWSQSNRSLSTGLLVLFALLLSCQSNPAIQKQKFFESGNRYLESGRFKEAVLEFSNAVQIDPRFASGHFKLGECYLRLERYPEAYRELQRTLELDPSNGKAALDLGLLLIAARSYEQAEATAAELLKNNSKSSDAHLLLSELYRAQGKLDPALQQIREAILLDPKQPQIYVQLGTVQRAVPDDRQAELSFKKALEIDPKFIAAVQSLAALYEDTGRTSDAELALRKGIELDPGQIDLRKALAQLYYSQQRKTEAEQVIVQAKRELGSKANNYRVLGEYYNNIGEADKALAEFASISKEHPADLQTREDYIKLLLSHNEPEKARKLNDAILKNSPKETGALVIRGTMLNAESRYRDAARILEDALRDAPENAYGHYQLGIAFSKTGNRERAKQEWFEAARLAPQMTEVQLALAEAARQDGDIGLLRETSEKLVRDNPLDARGYLLRAEAESHDKQTAAAERDLKKAIEISPQNASAYVAMGNFVRQHGESTVAKKYYEEALDRDPRSIEALAGIATILGKQRKKAVQRVQEQLTKTPDNDAAYLLLAGLQTAGKDLSGTEGSLQNALRINPNNADAMILLSKIQMARGERDSAIATAYQLVARSPQDAHSYFFAGTMEELIGRTEKAQELYRKALQIEPNYAPAANNLAYLMVQRGEDLDSALSLAQLARQKMPDSASAADTLAWVYYHQGLYGFAADLLREALQAVPTNATYHYHLGMVYEKQNKRAAAKTQLELALQINPDYPDAIHSRDTLR